MGISSVLSGVYYGKYEKAVHFVLAFFLTMVGGIFVSAGLAAAIVLLLSGAKEFWDAGRVNGHFDIFDMAANVAGIFLSLSLSWYVF